TCAWRCSWSRPEATLSHQDVRGSTAATLADGFMKSPSSTSRVLRERTSVSLCRAGGAQIAVTLSETLNSQNVRALAQLARCAQRPQGSKKNRTQAASGLKGALADGCFQADRLGRRACSGCTRNCGSRQ